MPTHHRDGHEHADNALFHDLHIHRSDSDSNSFLGVLGPGPKSGPIARTPPVARPVVPPPGPLNHWARTFRVDWRLFTFISERWLVEHLTWCRHPTEPWPLRPGEAISLRLVSWATLECAYALGPAAARAMRGAYDAAGDGPPALACFPGEGDRPAPLERWERYYLLDGLPVKYVGERWEAAALASCPYRRHAEEDGEWPGTWIVLRLVSLETGQSYYPLPEREVADLRRGP